MKFGRRSFLQWTAGLVGGTLLSPLPWKLADDSAVWSQNWSWRPSPKRGRITRAPTICTLCDGGCGIEAKLVDGTRAIALAGRPDHPVNQGGICPLGAAGLQFLYAPYRIPQPLKQIRRRGDLSSFKPISWEEALGELVRQLRTIRAEGRPHTVAGMTGRRRGSTLALWERFFTAYGSPNLFTMPSQEESLSTAARLSFGRSRIPAFALERAGFILSFEAGLIENWGAPGRMQAVFGRWRDAARTQPALLVQIEPRCSLTAAKADRWVAIKPGSSAILAMSMAHVMIRENLYDMDFMDRAVFGFDDWMDENGKRRMGFRKFALRSEHAPETVAEATGVAAERILELAREFAARKDAVAVWGKSLGDLSCSVYSDLVFVALNALKGNFAPDGLVSLEPMPPLPALPAVEPDKTARRGQAAEHLGYCRAASSAPFAAKSLYPFLDEIRSGGPYPVDVLLVHEANPLYSLPENGILEAALTRIGTLVSFSSYMDETTAMADLVLPNHTPLERLEDIIGLPGAPIGYYAVAAPIIEPQMDTRSTGDVILQLANELGDPTAGALPWKSHEAFLRERVTGLAESGRGAVAAEGNVDIWALTAGSPLKPNFKDGSDLWEKLEAGNPWVDAPMDFLDKPPTPSGKLELALSLSRKKGPAVENDALYLPHAVSLPPSGDTAAFPFLLITRRSLSLSSGYQANPPFLTKTLWNTILEGNESFAEIHPSTAQSINIGEGDRMVVKTPLGQVTVKAHLFAGAPPGTIGLIHGLGHKAYDEYISGKGVNPNGLIEVQLDPLTGAGTFWATRARAHRA